MDVESKMKNPAAKSLLISILSLFSIISSTQAQSALLTKSEELYHHQKYEEVVDLLPAEAMQTDDARIAELKANSLHKLGQFDEAIPFYDRSVSLEPQTAITYLERGICLISAGLLKDGEADLWHYIDETGDTVIPQYYLGVADYLLYDNKSSIAHLEVVLETDPQHFESYYLIAANRAEMGQWTKAENQYKKALALRPDHVASKQQLARVYFEQMRHAEALDILEGLQETGGTAEDALTAYYLGEAYFALKNEEDACTQWKIGSDLGDEDSLKNYEEICIKGGNRMRRKKHSYAQF